MNWKHINTAPRDGTEILGWRKDCGVILMQWGIPMDLIDKEQEGRSGDGWFCCDWDRGSLLEGAFTPTHWMPAPAPPVSMASHCRCLGTLEVDESEAICGLCDKPIKKEAS